MHPLLASPPPLPYPLPLPLPASSSEDLTEGVSFAVDYLGSTSILSEEAPGRETRYTQTQEAIDLIKVSLSQEMGGEGVLGPPALLPVA